jgi:hypothetical protein
MNIIATPQNHTEEAGVPDIVEPSPEQEAAREVEVQPPRRSRKPPIAVCAIFLLVVIGGLAYWKRAALPGLFDLALPYSSAIAFVSLGVIGVRYKDKYAHPNAARAALGIMVTFGFLMGVNTYREKYAAKVEKKNTADAIDKLADTVTANAGKTENSLKVLDGNFTDLKNKVKPDEVRSEMSSLRSTMEKVINPLKAELLFSFEPIVNPPLKGRSLIPIRDVTLPVNPDGSVHVRFTTINNTDVIPLAVELAIEICRGCKFAKEPEGFRKVEGSADTMRNYFYGDMIAAAPFQDLIVDVIPPVNTSSFSVQVSYRCKTCVLDREGTIGTIHIRER